MTFYPTYTSLTKTSLVVLRYNLFVLKGPLSANQQPRPGNLLFITDQ